MYRKEVNAQSPLRILDKSIHGGLGRGNLGLVMARAGVGKTACLVQIGLDDLMRERRVVHISLEQTVEHVMSWYDALFEDMAVRTDLADPSEVSASVAKARKIVSFSDHDIWPERLEKTVELFKKELDFKPDAILVDGYPFDGHTVSENAAFIGAFKAYAKMLEAELWMSAQTHRENTGDHPSKLTPPWDEYEDLVDVAIFLEPAGHDVTVRLLKDHDHEEICDTHLHLHPDSLCLVADDDTRSAVAALPPSVHTLLSGGYTAAEIEFGKCAERFGVSELTFTFEGHEPERRRGTVRLTEDELDLGDVSVKYFEKHMRRNYPKNVRLQRTLKSVWHQVNTAAEVFAVGEIQEDSTVKGGTGWAVELAKHQHKTVHIFDQERGQWFNWDGDAWAKIEEPSIGARRFTGTGTRHLNAAGKKAIEALFERSFG